MLNRFKGAIEPSLAKLYARIVQIIHVIPSATLARILASFLPRLVHGHVLRALMSPIILLSDFLGVSSRLSQGFSRHQLDRVMNANPLIYDCTANNFLKISDDYSRIIDRFSADKVIIVRNRMSASEVRRVFGFRPDPRIVFVTGKLHLWHYAIGLIAVIFLALVFILGAADISSKVFAILTFLISSFFVRSVEGNILDASLAQSNTQILQGLVLIETELAKIRDQFFAVEDPKGVRLMQDRCNFLIDSVRFMGDISSEVMIKRNCEYLVAQLDCLKEQITDGSPCSGDLSELEDDVLD